MQRIVLATGNQGKLAEIRGLLAGEAIEIVPQSEFTFTPAEETGTTFEENALLKARHAATASGLVAIADDSGICVEALNGEPGVYTARYAGPGASDQQNNDKLLAALHDVPEAQRGAAFYCVVAVVFPDPARAPLIASGRWAGQIATSAHGGGGFGYDPVFYLPELGRCSAELTPEEKNARSHRGQAFRKTAELLREHL